MKKSFKYEYEMTPKRKFYDALENIVNYALFFTFCGVIMCGVAFALVAIAFQ